ncbi:MAG: replication factor C small subunit [Candidatus Aenigmatarchaeota archaeon]
MQTDSEFDLWTEKYRPRTLPEIVGQKQIVKRLEAFVKKGVPNMLFAGPPGCGKTTAALCMARDLFGSDWRYNYLELNASDERGIDVVRHKIKDFARTKPMATAYKVICLDEADSLTSDAQHALRRTMEKYSKTSRFILICNYSSRIIEPIQSRCAIFRFKPLTKEEALAFMKKIAAAEKVDIEEQAFEALLAVAEGDMRRAINILQSSATAEKVTEATIYDMISGAHPAAIRELLATALKGDFFGSRQQLVKLLKDGIAGEDIVREMGKQVYDLQITDQQKIRLIEKVGEFEYRISSGGNEQIQLEALLAQLAAMK